ncbi:hypothetical protein C6P44_000339 [Monosporozyma unispora]|nr:hypothetical protein C6P44_000339 [Kazachstania unispora]
MSTTTSIYSPSSETHPSSDEHIDISEQNSSNNSNNPYRGSLFFEDTADSNRTPGARNSNLNVINRTSTHSFTVFIDYSRYDNFQSSSSSSQNLNTTTNTTTNTTRNTTTNTTFNSTEHNNSTSNILDSISHTDTHIIEPSIGNISNTTNVLTHDTHTISTHNTTADNSNPLRRTNTSNSRLIEIPTPQQPSSIIQQTHTNQPLLRRNHTSESMSTGDTEYFEAEDFLSSFNNSDNEINPANVPLLKTSTNNEDNDYNNMNDSERDSADSIDTQDTEILDTRIRNSQSLIQNVRDSVRTVSTMMLGQNPDSSVITGSNRKSNLDSLNEGFGINMSTPDSVSPMGKLTVKNRLSSETPSKNVSFDSTSRNNTNNNNNNNHQDNNTLINNLNHPTGEANISSLTEPSYSSLFQYDEYDDSIEPDIEQAVQLLKREVRTTGPTVNYVGLSNQQDNMYLQQNKQREEEDEGTDKDKTSSKSEHSTDSAGNFVPHELIIPKKLTISNPLTPIAVTSESHIPRSPSLINKYLVTPSPNRKSPSSYEKRHQRNVSLTNHANISPLYGSITLDSNVSHSGSSQPSIIPKVHVLQSVSGPNKWKPNPSTKAQMVSLLGSNEFRSPVKKLSFHEDLMSLDEYNNNDFDDIDMSPDKIFSAQSNNIPMKMDDNNNDNNNNNNTVNNEQDIDHDMPIAVRNTIITNYTTHTKTTSNVTQPLPAGISTIRYNTTTEIPTGQDNVDNMSGNISTNSRIRHPMYIQHIESPSIHTFDSQSNKFWDIYSLKRVIILIITCSIIPPLFFMIYAGSICGINDEKLMKIVLNKNHRIGLFRGFVWDIDLNWLRTLSLILGIVEVMIIFACVGIGFGVGLTR